MIRWHSDKDYSVIKTAAIFTVVWLLGVSIPAVAGVRSYFPISLSKETIACGSWLRVRKTPIVSEFENKWFSSHLSAANEPSLFHGRPQNRESNHSIRFTWLPTFDHPVIVRIEGLNSRSARLIAKQLSGAGGYAPGVISKSVDRPLTREEIHILRRLVANARLTTLSAKECSFGMDGSEWLVEIADRNEYHFLNRWTPEQDGVRDFGVAALKLTGWKFKHIY